VALPWLGLSRNGTHKSVLVALGTDAPSPLGATTTAAPST